MRGDPEDSLNIISLKESFRSFLIFFDSDYNVKRCFGHFVYRTFGQYLKEVLSQRDPKSERWSDGLGAWDAVVRNVHKVPIKIKIILKE